MTSKQKLKIKMSDTSTTSTQSKKEAEIRRQLLSINTAINSLVNLFSDDELKDDFAFNLLVESRDSKIRDLNFLRSQPHPIE